MSLRHVQLRVMIAIEAIVILLVVTIAIVWKVTRLGPQPLPIGQISLVVRVPPQAVNRGSPLNVGTKVRFLGQPATRRNRHWPLVRVLVPNSEIERGSAAAQVGSGSQPVLTYSLDARGSKAWCNWTSKHVNYFSPVVLGNTVVVDPTIQAAICVGQVEVSGLKAAQVQELAAEINR